MKLYLNKILWFTEDGIPDKNEVYLLPTIMFTQGTYCQGRLKTVYFHFIWLRWVRNIELLFSDKPE